MRILMIFLMLALVGGCASSSAQQSSSEQEIVAEPVAPEQEKPAAKADKKGKKVTEPAAKSAKGAKSEAAIRSELDATGHKLVAQATRTLRPSKAEKEVKQLGGEYVASYLEVDSSTLSTEMRKSTRTAGHYVGFVRYQEQVYECRGKTKQAALSAPCKPVSKRNMNELIHYDGAWRM